MNKMDFQITGVGKKKEFKVSKELKKFREEMQEKIDNTHDPCSIEVLKFFKTLNYEPQIIKNVVSMAIQYPMSYHGTTGILGYLGVTGIRGFTGAH